MVPLGLRCCKNQLIFIKTNLTDPRGPTTIQRRFVRSARRGHRRGQGGGRGHARQCVDGAFRRALQQGERKQEEQWLTGARPHRHRRCEGARRQDGGGRHRPVVVRCGRRLVRGEKEVESEVEAEIKHAWWHYPGRASHLRR